MSDLAFLHIGLDDADSHFGGCTTYVTYKILRRLLEQGYHPTCLPRLVRLNPYVPFKTRGNAATKIVLAVRQDEVHKVIDMVLTWVTELAEHRGKASPGIAFLITSTPNVPEELVSLYRKAVTDIVTRDLVDKVCGKLGVRVYGGRGVIGAVAALGAEFRDSTYELLVYTREPEIKQKLELDFDFLSFLDWITRPLTFANLDFEDRKILLMPSGPDPVLLGIRGDSPLHVLLFANFVLPLIAEHVEGWLLYKTNQATETHIEHCPDKAYTYMPERATDIALKSERVESRHVRLELQSSRLFVYRHLGEDMCRVENYVGYVLEWWGAKRLCLEGYHTYPEGIRVLQSLVRELRNPTCPVCGARLTSAGRRGMRCEKCGYVLHEVVKELYASSTQPERLLLLPKLSEHRHLMKPVSRLGLEELSQMFDEFPPLWIL